MQSEVVHGLWGYSDVIHSLKAIPSCTLLETRVLLLEPSSFRLFVLFVYRTSLSDIPPAPPTSAPFLLPRLLNDTSFRVHLYFLGESTLLIFFSISIDTSNYTNAHAYSYILRPHRCGNVASILELDEHLAQEYKVFKHAPSVRVPLALA